MSSKHCLHASIPSYIYYLKLMVIWHIPLQINRILYLINIKIILKWKTNYKMNYSMIKRRIDKSILTFLTAANELKLRISGILSECQYKKMFTKVSIEPKKRYLNRYYCMRRLKTASSLSWPLLSGLSGLNFKSFCPKSNLQHGFNV